METFRTNKKRCNKGKIMKQFCKMHFTILSFLTLLLNGCAGTSSTEKLSITAKNTIEAAEKTLKPECKTPETLALLKNASSTIDGMLATCEQQVEVLDVKLSNRNLIIAFESFLLVLVVGLYLRKIL